MIVKRSVVFCVLAINLFAATALTAGEKKSRQLFIEASEHMALRTPGSAPFHLHAAFQANPGEELLGPNQKSSIIAGVGTFDELWIEPHRWRREVTLGGYRAVESESNGVRRFQASSEYEPSRVVMLLDAVFTPVPRVLIAKEFHDGDGWTIDPVTSGGISLTRLSRNHGSQRADFTDSFYLIPSSGVLVLSNFQGLNTFWSKDGLYDGKVVPKELTIKAGDNVLLTAEISVEPARDADIGGLAMDGPPAVPGMTLRPLHLTEVRMPDLSGSFSYVANQLGPSRVFSMIGTLDRDGKFRELEILLAPSGGTAATIVQHFRDEHARPATIDGSACQVRMLWRVM